MPAVIILHRVQNLKRADVLVAGGVVGARLCVVEHQNLFVRHQAQLGLAHFRLRRVPLHARELLHLPVGQRHAREVGEILQGGRPLHLARLFGAGEVRAVGGENGARERDGQLRGHRVGNLLVLLVHCSQELEVVWEALDARLLPHRQHLVLVGLEGAVPVGLVVAVHGAVGRVPPQAAVALVVRAVLHGEAPEGDEREAVRLELPAVLQRRHRPFGQKELVLLQKLAGPGLGGAHEIGKHLEPPVGHVLLPEIFGRELHCVRRAHVPLHQPRAVAPAGVLQERHALHAQLVAQPQQVHHVVLHLRAGPAFLAQVRDVRRGRRGGILRGDNPYIGGFAVNLQSLARQVARHGVPNHQAPKQTFRFVVARPLHGDRVRLVADLEGVRDSAVVLGVVLGDNGWHLRESELLQGQRDNQASARLRAPVVPGDHLLVVVQIVPMPPAGVLHELYHTGLGHVGNLLHNDVQRLKQPHHFEETKQQAVLRVLEQLLHCVRRGSVGVVTAPTLARRAASNDLHVSGERALVRPKVFGVEVLAHHGSQLRTVLGPRGLARFHFLELHPRQGFLPGELAELDAVLVLARARGGARLLRVPHPRGARLVDPHVHHLHLLGFACVVARLSPLESHEAAHGGQEARDAHVDHVHLREVVLVRLGGHLLDLHRAHRVH
mmetsp:Transcript_46622/g.86814  ORF Transcript_46622/g.86814 Transcript_46622/m.86814 type:complete len:665 (-) Transcript_46622:1062-3056(-)